MHVVKIIRLSSNEPLLIVGPFDDDHYPVRWKANLDTELGRETTLGSRLDVQSEVDVVPPGEEKSALCDLDPAKNEGRPEEVVKEIKRRLAQIKRVK